MAQQMDGADHKNTPHRPPIMGSIVDEGCQLLQSEIHPFVWAKAHSHRLFLVFEYYRRYKEDPLLEDMGLLCQLVLIQKIPHGFAKPS